LSFVKMRRPRWQNFLKRNEKNFLKNLDWKGLVYKNLFMKVMIFLV